jgi:hypothetical protein
MFKEIELKNLKKYSAKERPSKVQLSDLADPLSGKEFPDLLKSRELHEFVEHCYLAYKKQKPIWVGLGGHVIKCGLSPYLIDLMKKGIIKGFSCNGSVTIHDFELAMFGKTSEDVATALEDGSFGMATDTCDTINDIISKAAKQKSGYGESIGKFLVNAPFRQISLLAAAQEYMVPVTVHVALGTDINHQHETADGEAIGSCSLRDFRIFINQLSQLNEGGVFINFGSAVILPEVFLKAITVLRNLGYPMKNFYTAVFDMNSHYRPWENIVRRPTLSGGKGYYFVGHHEIMLPLFYRLLLNRIGNEI